jgi:hypothetical protein
MIHPSVFIKVSANPTKTFIYKNLLPRDMQTKAKQTHRKDLAPKKEMFAIVIILLAVLVVIQVLNTGQATEPVIAEQDTLGQFRNPETGEQVVIQQMDFPTTDAGTFVGVLQKEYFKEPIDKVVILFVSARIPGLSLIYYPSEKRLIGGTPQMSVDQIILFDGLHHEIKYSFEKGGQQQLFYDEQLVANAKFTPPPSDAITGMLIGVSRASVSKGLFKVEVR